ncbi:MAG: diacylglycerol kinase family lipid kinase [Oscillibacter sp.]|nr:diacylglycerol kinase family lipid kinase [Oscillibacter sp.]MBQ9618844.1 diacylglycerol kinase family lipid kinase [Oscillibacter sp.]
MDAQEKKLLMIVNPRAGRNKSRGPLYDAAAIFSGNGYLVRIHNTVAPGDARDCARREGGHYDAVVAVGGDGTLNEVVTGLMKLEHPPALGYLPQGSTNDFAASLRLSQDPAEAAMTVAQSPGRRLDIGQWNRRYFVYVASFGAFTRSSYSAPQNVKNALGHFAYFLEGVKDLDSLRPYPIRLTADGESLDGEYLFGAVCNTLSIGGIVKLTPEQVALDDGQFELLLVPNPRTPADLQDFMVSFMNQDYAGKGLVFRHASSIHVETDDVLPWSLDGEYAPGVPSVDITNRPRALSMLL